MREHRVNMAACAEPSTKLTNTSATVFRKASGKTVNHQVTYNRTSRRATTQNVKRRWSITRARTILDLNLASLAFSKIKLRRLRSSLDFPLVDFMRFRVEQL